ncbi:MAG: hypothetical protein ACE5F5_10480, partial [Acidimicrobiia bacterium]
TRADIADLREATRTDIADSRADLAGLRQATRTDIADLREATRADIADLRETTKAEFARVDADMRDMKLEIRELRTDMNTGFAAVNERFDRMYLMLTAGLFVIVAAIAGVFINTL